MYKIMVVDDDSISLSICKALLSSEFEVILAKSSLQAIGYLKSSEKPDMILLDMMMPGMTGMEMLKTLKNDEMFRSIPVLFLTSMDTEQFEVEGFTNGAVDFIKKPVVPELLKLKIDRQIYFTNLKKENQILKDKLERIKSIL